MGRCYEFGVSIREGCEHAMVVPSSGGRCVCESCGVACLGKFSGCDMIVSQPGYIPVAAPAWAKPGGEGRSPAAPSAIPAIGRAAPLAPQPPATTGAPSESMVSVRAELVGVRSVLEELLSRPDRAADAIQALNHELAGRDAELADAFVRLSDAFDRLTAEVSADRVAREAVIESIRALTEKLEAAQGRGPLFGLRRAP